MTVVSSRVFAENPIHYLDLAIKEEVAIKRGKKVFVLLPRDPKYVNPSPSGDPYWADPRNMEELESRLQERDEGKVKALPLTPEKRKEWFGDL